MTTEAPRVSKAMSVTGWILTVIPVLLFLMGVAMVLSKSPKAIEGMTQHGYPVAVATPLAIVELACAIIYLFPPTSVLGAILMTGYLGGAVATHVRVGEPYYLPIIAGVFVWGGLFLRDRRLRVLIPFRFPPKN